MSFQPWRANSKAETGYVAGMTPILPGGLSLASTRSACSRQMTKARQHRRGQIEIVRGQASTLAAAPKLPRRESTRGSGGHCARRFGPIEMTLSSPEMPSPASEGCPRHNRISEAVSRSFLTSVSTRSSLSPPGVCRQRDSCSRSDRDANGHPDAGEIRSGRATNSCALRVFGKWGPLSLV